MAAATDSLDDVTTSLTRIVDYIRWGASRFVAADLSYGHGSDNAIDEAAHLVLDSLGLDHHLPDAYLASQLTRAERQAAAAVIQRRIHTRLPAPYITGKAWFAGLEFFVDERVIVPRSPIAELIESGFSAWFPELPPTRVLDMCTGSGCIGIATALVMPTAEVDLVDISSEALEVARRNIERHDVAGRVIAVQSDLFAGVAGKRYDLIVSNPPYVDTFDLSNMPQEFGHEPALALGAGDDGLDIVRRILREARDYLTDDGVLIVEVGNSERHLMEAFPEVPFMWLEFERGGNGVFAIDAQTLEVCAPEFA
ncbi:MAG TPA: 50S ribosomal protein L3 N(5)-glutamine methyltransferase [Cobetia sp.]|nr:50S ribosomal protein L3 N(5)-glutamine methyltransferase [Cobetia sp.]